jgi:ligand-binding sensor domain-containing protein
VLNAGVALLFVCLTRTPAWALNPSLDITQYAHTAWKLRDGFVSGDIWSLAQTPDGYLWIGTTTGLFRFDGIKAVLFQPPGSMANKVIRGRALLASRDGTLWIDTGSGIASWKDGRFSEYATPPGVQFGRFVEDRAGTIWIGTIYPPPGRLCSVQTAGVQCSKDLNLGPAVSSLFEDSKGALWAGLSAGLLRWKPDPPQMFVLPPLLNGYRVAERNGALLVGLPDGLARFAAGKTELVDRAPPLVRPVVANTLLRDRDGGVWMGTTGGGLALFHDGSASAFTQADGLSGNLVHDLFEDREGTIWVATNNGLDRFRDVALPGVSVRQGLSNDAIASVIATRDGGVWIGTFEGVNQWDRGRVVIYREHPRPTPHGVREVVFPGFPERIHSLFQDAQDRLWISDRRGVGYLEKDRYVPVAAAPESNLSDSYVYSIVGNNSGDIWILMSDVLVHVRANRVLAQQQWSTLGLIREGSPPMTAVVDPMRGGLWLGFRNGGVAHLAGGRVRASYSAADGLGGGGVWDLRATPDGTMWVSTEQGLSRIKDGRIATLNAGSGLPCDGVNWSIDDDAGSVWLFMPCGLVRVARTDIEAWAAGIDQNGSPPRVSRYTLFDGADGVRLLSQRNSAYNPQVSKGPDGRIWFAARDAVNVIDPRRESIFLR